MLCWKFFLLGSLESLTRFVFTDGILTAGGAFFLIGVFAPALHPVARNLGKSQIIYMDSIRSPQEVLEEDVSIFWVFKMSFARKNQEDFLCC